MFNRPASQKTTSGEEENPFLLSFSDLMASLLSIFILALVVLMIQLHLKQEELEKERQRVKVSLIELRDALGEIQGAQAKVAEAIDGVGIREKSLEGILVGIQQDLKEKGIEVIVTENGSVLRIPEQALSFETNKYSIQPHYQSSADLIGQALLSALSKRENIELLDTVFIEGHTDAVPNRREMGNWGLSTYRAISLWLYWTKTPGNVAGLESLKSLPRESQRQAQPLISTSGYAETRPSAPPNTDEFDAPIANPADRRIDIRFTLASTDKKDLGEIREGLDKMKKRTDDLIEKLKDIEE